MSKNSKGWVQGMIGVAIFAGSLPATRLAVRGFDPVFLTGVRALIAALLGAALLWLLRQRPPERKDLPALALTALGVVAGFPLLTALALQQASAARAMVFVGLLPLCTALFAVWRGGERPRPAFWLFSGAGALCVSAYAALDGSAGSIPGDLMMLGAVLICGLGYAEGAGLARRLGGWQVISWALVLSVPVMLPLALWCWPPSLVGIGGGLAGPGLRFGFQHAGGLRVLVSRVGAGRYCCGRATAVAATVPGPGAGSRSAA